jgi:arsenate reductase (thioredoxin)
VVPSRRAVAVSRATIVVGPVRRAACGCTLAKRHEEDSAQMSARHPDDGAARQAAGSRPLRVLFLCTHNSARSQMAEGLLRARGGSRFVACSAGTHPGDINPLAVRAMAELGIAIDAQAGHYAKAIEAFAVQPPMDLVVTVCDEAAEECPIFPGARRQEHWSFPDPSQATGTDEERLAVFRQVRDAIAARIDAFLVRTG